MLRDLAEEINPDAINAALLLELRDGIFSLKEEMGRLKEEIAKLKEKNDLHLRFELDLSIERDNELIADFDEMGIEVNALTIPAVPSALTIRFNSQSEEPIELSAKQRISISEYEIRRIYITNSAGSGIAYIHVFGKRK